MRFATYNRRSVYSDRSDSVSNQERMCRDYAEARFPGQVGSWTAYKDEGYTGGNTDRPGLQKLLRDVDAGRVDALVVYQLDRLSRSVRDFADIYDRLEAKGVKFLSVKENMDTESPMGRAMIYITMVFAQMERETIKERVTDNMYGLAQKGLWLLGDTPVGYVRKKLVLDGKTHWTLEIDPEPAEFLRELFRRYTSGWSLKELSRDYARPGAYTPTGVPPSRSRLHRLLTNPVVCAASPETYDYWKAKGCDMSHAPREAWDGTHGVYIYGRRRHSDRSKCAPVETWIVVPGQHPPILDSGTWLEAQRVLSQNTFIRPATQEPRLLKGVLRCALCGRRMAQKMGTLREGKFRPVYYACEGRIEHGKDVCGLKYARVEVLDEKVMEFLRTAVAEDGELADPGAGKNRTSVKAELEAGLFALKASEKKLRKELDNLAESLAEVPAGPARKHVLEALERKDKELEGVLEEIGRTEDGLRDSRRLEEEMRKKKLTAENFIREFESMDPWARNKIMRSLLRDCTWDGTTLTVEL